MKLGNAGVQVNLQERRGVVKCSTCGSQHGHLSEPEANDEQWWTCAECGDEWLLGNGGLQESDGAR